jgi:hypothetical protein
MFKIHMFDTKSLCILFYRMISEHIIFIKTLLQCVKMINMIGNL